ncbi:MAG: mechanosensitive ion channel [Epsilonproteobacteria bacterium]|nr:mechanosensitive ion channel [Campylobacterota bacterium]
MQKFILLFIFITSSFSAQIDTTLFEGENLPKYYARIAKDINSSITQKLKSEQIISLERSTLQKLQQLHAVKDEIKTFETITFSDKQITQQTYLKALYLLQTLYSEIDRLHKKEKNIQQKLFALKSQIEKSLPKEQNRSLLSNQMQYAFYKISQDKITQSLTQYEALYKKEFDLFYQALDLVNFKEQSSKQILKNVDRKIETITEKNLLLTIDKDSEALQNSAAQKKIESEERSIQKERDETLVKKLEAQILLSLKHLKAKDHDNYLETLELIEVDLSGLSKAKRETFENFSKLLIDFGEQKFDTASVTLATTQLGIKNIINQIESFITKTLFVYEDKAFSIKTVLTFAILLFIGFFIAKIYKNIVDSFRKSNRIKNLSVARMIANSGYYLIILITFFIALRAIGLDMHTIFVVIGAILLWIALGLQGFISNYAMGILIKIDRSIRIGDQIELDIHTAGIVDDMDFRSITLLTSDHTRITIPNSRFFSNSFINHSLEEDIKRIHIAFSAPNSIDYELIQDTVLSTLAKSEVPHIKTTDKQAQVVIIDINRKIVRYKLLVWINQADRYDMVIEKSPFLALIHQSLKKVAL